MTSWLDQYSFFEIRYAFRIQQIDQTEPEIYSLDLHQILGLHRNSETPDPNRLIATCVILRSIGPCGRRPAPPDRRSRVERCCTACQPSKLRVGSAIAIESSGTVSYGPIREIYGSQCTGSRYFRHYNRYCCTWNVFRSAPSAWCVSILNWV